MIITFSNTEQLFHKNSAIFCLRNRVLNPPIQENKKKILSIILELGRQKQNEDLTIFFLYYTQYIFIYFDPT